MLDALAALPFWQAFLALFAAAMVRSNGTYWVGRGAVAGWRRYRGAHGELTARAERLIHRFGPFAVTLSYLTVGIQTAIHLTAGVVRMPLRWYLPAAVVGSVAWAVLYATIGLAVVQAWLAAEAGSWWGAVVVVVAVGALVAWLVARRRRATTVPPRLSAPPLDRAPRPTRVAPWSQLPHLLPTRVAPSSQLPHLLPTRVAPSSHLPHGADGTAGPLDVGGEPEDGTAGPLDGLGGGGGFLTRPEHGRDPCGASAHYAAIVSPDPSPEQGRGLVLVVEDEPAIADVLRLNLRAAGYGVEVVGDGASALEAARDLRPSAIVLDIGLPVLDGIEVCRRLRGRGDWTPVLFVTARDDEVDRIVGLELGADDYVTKPFSPRELVARLGGVLRRTRGETGAPEVLRSGDLTLDLTSHEVRVAGAEIALTATEFDLLSHLLRRPGVVFTREQLLSDVWGYAATAGARTVDVHVAQVRAKLGAASPIRTVRSVGYAAERAPDSRPGPRP